MNNKPVFPFILLFVFAECGVYAQEEGDTTGCVGFEINNNSLLDAAIGMAFYFNHSITDEYAAGFKILGSSDVREMSAVEGELSLRWYCVQGSSFAGFIQAGSGGVFVRYHDENEHNSERRVYVLGSAAAGLRINVHIDNSPVFLEPYIRFAYPSGLGAGFLLGGKL
jgi:hypothetical protein